MKSTHSLCLIGLLSLGFFSIAQAQQPASSVEKTITAQEDLWTESEKTNNPDLIAPHLADKFVAIGTDGAISDRKKMLADTKLTKYDSVAVEQFHVAVFGDAAIATMVLKLKGTDEKGKPLDLKARYADTWIKMPNGDWQCVLSQGSKLK